MLHGIEIVFENKEETRNLLKNCPGTKQWYGHRIISMVFAFECEFYLDGLNQCLKILKDNKIPYLRIEF